MSLRALHIVNEPSGPGGLFLPALENRGFAIDSIDTAQNPLPDTLAGYDAVISCGGTANAHETDVYTCELPAGGQFVDGPALVEFPGHTVVVPPDWHARTDELGNLLLTR